MKPKLFLIIVALLAGPYLLGVGYFAATEQQPFDGDLTRISALSEASFGWNEPQEAYKAEYHFPTCLLYTSPSPRDQRGSRMPSSA